MITRIHVNQHIIKKNSKNGEVNPVLSVKTYKSNTYGRSVMINGPSRVIYRPENPLPCGAKCWIETESQVQVIV